MRKNYPLRQNGLLDKALDTIDLSDTLQPAVTSAMYSNIPPAVESALAAFPTKEQSYAIGSALGKDAANAIDLSISFTKKPVGEDSGPKYLRLTDETYDTFINQIPFETTTSFGATSLKLPIQGPIATTVSKDRINELLEQSVDPMIEGAVDGLLGELKPKIIWGAVGASAVFITAGFFLGKWYARRK